MYKEENISLFCKELCLVLFIVLIICVNSAISLICLFAFFSLITKKEYNYFYLFLLLISIFFLVVGYISGNLITSKIILIVDFIYYFIRGIKSNKMSFKKVSFTPLKYTYCQLSKTYREIVTTKVRDCIQKKVIGNNLVTNERFSNGIKFKIDNEINEKLVVNYLRFYKNQNDCNVLFKFDYANIIYLSLHMSIMVLVVVISL